jgi:hypothetical protein
MVSLAASRTAGQTVVSHRIPSSSCGGSTICCCRHQERLLVLLLRRRPAQSPSPELRQHRRVDLARKTPTHGRGGGEPRGIRRASTMRDDRLYNASLRVSSASGNGAQASPRKTTHGSSVGERGGQTAKAPLHRRLLPMESFTFPVSKM